MGRIGDERLRGLRHRRLAEPPSHYSIVPFVPQQPGAEGHLAWLHVILAGGGKSGNRRVFGRTAYGDGHTADCWVVRAGVRVIVRSRGLGQDTRQTLYSSTSLDVSTARRICSRPLAAYDAHGMDQDETRNHERDYEHPRELDKEK